ncbi:MAG: bifunctional phosphoribosyl-AMP cyclohydrolase/phosphoribosyl-ATP diphosphatase HisIE [Candidatus Eremiobacteraeota bacterium]|nr:bifunctional phosphoribosyl-AMP cyclohydrolase/phosphoribosyl-ATP diphosphatase HisIE [Candidatus Eremiobacteraeota bacterium]
MSIDDLAWGESGLLPVVIQSARDGAVLTLAYANREALRRTIEQRTTWLYSRSRQALWMKGETSGHTQTIRDVVYDCDADALLYSVDALGPACHTGARSCFATSLLDDVAPPPGPPGSFETAVAHLRETIAARRGAPVESSYTAKLFHDGIDRIAKKVGEEATEVVIAVKNGDRAEITWEVADLLFHTLVLLEERGVSLDDVGTELLRRAK